LVVYTVVSEMHGHTNIKFKSIAGSSLFYPLTSRHGALQCTSKLQKPVIRSDQMTDAICAVPML